MSTAHAADAAKTRPAPLVLQEQGSFAAGGTVVRNPGTFNPGAPGGEGQTLHGDHARVFYQVPVNARKLPLVMWHGFGQFGKTWETTADGREGFQNLFLRLRYPVYLVDQPRRGGAARGRRCREASAQLPDEQRLGSTCSVLVADQLSGVQFSRDPEALNQFFRQMVPDTGPIDAKVVTDGVSAVFDKTGPAVLVTHSHSGGFGWTVAMKNRNVRAIVSYEPGSGFVFPEGEVPAPMPSLTGALEGVAVPMTEFLKLTGIPIIIYYGDNIPQQPSEHPGEDNWAQLAMAGHWCRGVSTVMVEMFTLVHLPAIGDTREHALPVLRPEQRTGRSGDGALPVPRSGWTVEHFGRAIRALVYCGAMPTRLDRRVYHRLDFAELVRVVEVRGSRVARGPGGGVEVGSL